MQMKTVKFAKRTTLVFFYFEVHLALNQKTDPMRLTPV